MSVSDMCSKVHLSYVNIERDINVQKIKVINRFCISYFSSHTLIIELLIPLDRENCPL